MDDQARRALRLKSVEEVITLLQEFSQAEWRAMFAQGDVLLAALDAGLDSQCGGRQHFWVIMAEAVSATTMTLRRRVRTSRVFAPGERNEAVPWTVHWKIAEWAERDGRVNPLEWLSAAADNAWSAKDVDLAIAAALGDKEIGPQKVVIARNMEASVLGRWRDGVMLGLPGLELPTTARVLVSVTLLEGAESEPGTSTLLARIEG